MVVALLALLAATPMSEGKTDMAQRCAKPGVTMISDRAPKARLRKLGEEPPAKHYRAVFREVDGCPKPVVLRENIGDDPAR